MRIVKLIFMQTGGQSKQFIRPFETNVTGNTLDALQEATDYGRNVASSALTGIASRIMKPTASVESEAAIANGWENSRLRFYMEIETGNDLTGGKLIQILTGFTDYVGLSHQGTVDPNMRLYFNSTVTLKSGVIWTDHGQAEQIGVVQSSQLLMGDSNFNGFKGLMQHTMRPDDVFNTLSSGALSDNANIVDGRTGFVHGPQRSNRNNAYAPDYLEKTIRAYQNASSQNKYSQLGVEVANSAKGYVRDPSMVDDPLFGYIRRNTSYSQTSSITYQELCVLSPETDNIAQIITTGKVVKQTTNFGMNDMSNWNGANYETIEASTISQAVPAIMMELMLSKINVCASNDTVGYKPITTIQGYQSFTTKMDMRHFITMFIQRFTDEILIPMTHYGQRKVNLRFEIDLLGVSYIWIQLGDNHPYEFSCPSFSDAVFSPLITNNISRLQTLASDFDQIFNTISVPSYQQFAPPQPVKSSL